MNKRVTDLLVDGIPLPCTEVPDGPLALRHHQTAANLWKVAYDLGVLLQQETGDKKPILPDDQNQHDLDAWLWVVDGRAVAVLATQELAFGNFQWLDDIDNGVHNNWQSCPGSYRIVCVWVAKRFRNNGIARRLVNEAAGAYGIEAEDFAHSLPLSDDGRAFAKKIAGGRVRVA